ncbi:MAG: MFS transporter [Vicinamibacteria bacterium]
MKRSNAVAVFFSSIGHLLIHFCTAFFFVIVLTLEQEWELPYHDLLELWTLGSLLVGLAALPAGLLSDRLGASTMMAVFFLGMGGASCVAGLTSSPGSLMLALAAIGVFASIYHPVGIPWLVRNTELARGKALGINGVFGNVGSAMSGVVSGALIDVAGWRAAFLVPGVFTILVGVALVLAVAFGLVQDRKSEPGLASTESSSDSRKVFSILLVTMFVGGLIYHSTQASLPKLIELRHQGLVGEGALGVGFLVALVYAAAGATQVIGGHLADRLPLKKVYMGAILFQVPLLVLASSLGGPALLAIATLMVMGNTAALPAENLLLARYTPEKRHGLAFGVKFVLFFAAAPLAVTIASFVSARTGEFYWLYVFLAGSALVALLFAALLPGKPRAYARPAVLTDPPAVPNMD